jgi:hypothetical protein
MGQLRVFDVQLDQGFDMLGDEGDGATTTPTPSRAAWAMASGVEGPSHVIGPTRLW